MTEVFRKTYMEPTYRKKSNRTIVQGSKNIRALLDNDFRINKIGVTVPEKWKSPEQVQDPALEVLHNPDKWPATSHFVNSIDVARKFMGTGSQPGMHELWAEVRTDQFPLDKVDTSNFQRVLIVDSVHNDEHLGEIIRAARGFAFDGGFLTRSEKTDMYSLAALRSSRLQTLVWPSKSSDFDTAVKTVKGWGFVPIFIRPLSDTALEDARIGIPRYWRGDGEKVNVKELEGRKIAVVVSGQSRIELAPDDVCMSIPLAVPPHAKSTLLTSLSITQTTAIAMAEIGRLMRNISLKQNKGLEPSDPEILEGRMITKQLSSVLGVRRKLTPKQEYMIQKRQKRQKFGLDWARDERIFDTIVNSNRN
jgi:tRNA G18 (ribose-2'-O)-methylase SpoU